MFDMSQPVSSGLIVDAIVFVFALVGIGLGVVKYYEKRYKEQK